MFARVSTIQGKPELVAEGIRNFREQIMPAVKKMAGFKGAYLLAELPQFEVASNLEGSFSRSRSQRPR
jgi:hypothetical protein